MSTLKASTKEKKDYIVDNILDNVYAAPENDELILIDGTVSYDQMAAIVDYLRDATPKPIEWTEEDEKILTSILRDVMHGEPLDKLQYDWLKSLRPQPKQEWTEEDESCLDTVIHEMQSNKKEAKSYEHKTYDKLIYWLKNIKERIKA